MKRIYKIFIVVIIAGFAVSCVSTKKYKSLMAEKLNMDKKYSDMYTKYTVETSRFDSLSNKYVELDKKKKELAELSQSEQEKLNAELQKKLDLLTESNKKISEMQSAIDKQKAASEKLLSKIKDALLGFTSDELTVEMRDGKVYVSLSEKLLFKSGSSTVDKKGKEALAKVGEVLAKQTDIDIVIEGHTDNIPLKGDVIKDNWDLSVMRATTIVRILTTDYGVDPTQIIPSGRGENFPIADNKTDEGRAKNRRTEIILAPKMSELIKIIENK